MHFPTNETKRPVLRDRNDPLENEELVAVVNTACVHGDQFLSENGPKKVISVKNMPIPPRDGETNRQID